MSRRQITQILCDMCQKEAPHSPQFTWEGKTYEIDVCAEHHGEVTSVFTNLIDKARPVRPRPSASKTTNLTRKERDLVRAWAIETGLDVAPTGRIPKLVVEKYRTAHA